VPAPERAARADRYLKLVGLGGFEDTCRARERRMRQRAAIARALAI